MESRNVDGGVESFCGTDESDGCIQPWIKPQRRSLIFSQTLASENIAEDIQSWQSYHKSFTCSQLPTGPSATILPSAFQYKTSVSALCPPARPLSLCQMGSGLCLFTWCQQQLGWHWAHFKLKGAVFLAEIQHCLFPLCSLPLSALHIPLSCVYLPRILPLLMGTTGCQELISPGEGNNAAFSLQQSGAFNIKTCPCWRNNASTVTRLCSKL